MDYDSNMAQKDELLNEFGARLKAERNKQKFTQQTLADMSHTKQEYIAQLELGRRNPSLRTLINILAALNVSADRLIYGSPNKDDETETAMYIIKEFNEFLLLKGVKELSAYYDMCKYMEKHIEK